MLFSELADLLQKANVVTDIIISTDADITDLNLMDQEYRDFSSNTVYFINASQIGPGTAIPSCLLYLGEIPEEYRKRLSNSARITTSSIAAAFRYVKTELDSAPQAQEQYANLVSKMLMGVSLNTVLTEAFSYTGNLFVAIDISGKILANSTPFYVDYPLWMNSVQQGYCDEILMDYIDSRRRVLRLPGGKAAFSLYCSKIDMNILVARIIHEKETLGYFFALNRRPSFDQQTIKLLPLFAERVKNNIVRLKNANTHVPIAQTNILMDAISGATPAEIQMRTKVCGFKFQKNMRVYLFKSSYTKDPDYFQSTLLPVVSGLFPNQPCFPWKSSVVCLVGTDQNGAISAEISQNLMHVATDYHLFVGISNVFSQVSEFSAHFQQAKDVLKFANRAMKTGPLFYYLDYAMYMILDSIDNEKFLAYCCHPALQQLLSYDEKNGTDLFSTLNIFAKTGFNKTSTAQALYVHRNTVNYRIQQIEELCGIDLSNEKLLFPLQLSFQIFAYRQSRLIDHK